MPARPVVLSVFLSHVDHLIDGDNAKLIDIARICEEAGADQLVFSEHVALAQKIEGVGEAAIFPFPSNENYPEPLISLAAIAGATQSIRLATGILIAPLRPAIVLAKMVATLDQFSRGRLDLGVGTGWHDAEFAGAGVDRTRAMEILENMIAACRELWAGGPSSFSSSTVTFDSLFCQPTPLSGRDLPVWFAGPPTKKSAQRIARLGQGWIPFGNLSPDDVKRGSDHLRAAEQESGLAAGALGIRASLPTLPGTSIDEMLDKAIATVPAFIAAGATQVQLPLWRYAKTMDDVEPVISGARQRLNAL